MISLKQDVDVRGLQPIMWDLIYVLEALYLEENNTPLVITSGLDGVHSKNSLHYVGLAIDIRTRTLNNPKDMFNKIFHKIPKAFDIILHSTHIHIEYQPKNQDERGKPVEWL